MNTLILLIAHFPTASAFREALDAMRLPYDKNTLHAFDVHNVAKPKETIASIEQIIKKYSGQSVLILTDLIGSSPFHIAKQLATLHQDKQIRLITGVNLPMVLKAISYQTLPVDELSTKILLSTTESIVIL